MAMRPSEVGLQVRAFSTEFIIWLEVQLVGMAVVREDGRAIDMLPFNATMLDRVNSRFITVFSFWTVASEDTSFMLEMSEGVNTGYTFR